MPQYDLTDQYKGFGVSQGLDRGLLVYHGDILLVEEGMGIGACAFQTGGFTYFASTTSIQKDQCTMTMTASLDKKLVWRIFGIKSEFITRIFEADVKNSYMKREKNQDRLLRRGTFLRKMFHVDAVYAAAAPQGQVVITYQTNPDEISVDVSFKSEIGGMLFVMNELGGSLFDKGLINGARTVPPTGWQALNGLCELYSDTHAMAFTIIERHVPGNVRSKLCWGREVTDAYSWAGFECELVCGPGEFDHYQYAIKFREEVN